MLQIETGPERGGIDQKERGFSYSPAWCSFKLSTATPAICPRDSTIKTEQNSLIAFEGLGLAPIATPKSVTDTGVPLKLRVLPRAGWE